MHRRKTEHSRFSWPHPLPDRPVCARMIVRESQINDFPMKYAFLIAWREFAESAKAKGFWIGLFIMPAILFFSIQAPIWLEQKATPVRYFVVIDQSHDLAPVIESRMEKVYQERVL